MLNKKDGYSEYQKILCKRLNYRAYFKFKGSKVNAHV